MNTSLWKQFKYTSLLGALLVSSLTLNACGGSGSSSGGDGFDTTAGIGGTGIVAGKTTGFGSIYVNGSRFDTSQSQFIVDGEVLDQNALAVGMIVRLKVETENGVYTGDALEVVYDDEVQGPIDDTAPGIEESPNGTQKTFKVFGQTITIDDTSTRFEGTTFGTILENDVVEISGFRISETEVSATYVKKTGVRTFNVSEVELRGTIDNYLPAPNEMFDINGITITVDRSDPDLDLEVPGGVLEDDLYVEVKGILTAVMEIEAKRIELEDEDFGEDVDDVRLQGIISQFGVAGPAMFEIDGQLVDAAGAEIEPNGATLADGIEVEVEGDIEGGVLYAEEVEVEEEETKLRSFISSVDVAGNSFEVDFPFTMGASTGVVVKVDGQTVFEDDTGGPVNTIPFSLDDLRPNLIEPGVFDFVRVEGQEVNGEVIATVVKRVDPDDERRIEAVVDDYAPDNFITLLGITYQLVPGTTEYEPPGFVIEIGDFVEVSDTDEPPGDPADGIADEVEEE